MKLNIFKNIGKLLLCSALLIAPGCSDFLEEQDPSNLTPENFYTIPEHAEAGLAAIYADARFIGGGAGIFSSNWQMLEAPTGQSTTETAQNSDLNNLYGLIYDGNTGHVLNWWTGLYQVIAQANLVIDRVPDIPIMNETRRTQVLGEARFMRAWAYFYAVRLWGDVPLITTPQTTESPDFFPSRASQEEVYGVIVDDLLAAEASGLPWMDVSGHVSLAAVKSQLAKVYLTMAGYPLRKTENYQKAADKAYEVIAYANANPGTINLFSTYGEIHQESLKNRLEHIFQLQYNTAVAGNPMDNMYPNFKPITFAGPSGTGSTVPTLEFYNSYEEGDLRAKDREGYFYTNYYRNGNGDLFNLGAPYIFKHFNVTANGTAGVPGTRQNNLNVPIIRYAEVLLIYAEAQNEVSGPTQEAYNAFKRIRDRAQLVTPELGTYTQASFREAVWKERWHELAYEFITWFDMVRLRKGFTPVTGQFEDFVGHVHVAQDEAFQEKHLFFPIPRIEIQNNPNLKPQNPGYPQE